MRSLTVLLLLPLAASVLAAPALAQSKKPAIASKRPAAAAAGPHAIGYFDDWTAAVHREAGEKVCYAFTRAASSTPAIAGRGDVVLTVTERPASRDVVAISAGFAYSRNASVSVGIEQTSMDFYTAQRSAFARDGHAAAQAFQRGRLVIARSPGPRGQIVSDHFSLRGFSAAYAAIGRACPPGKGAAS